MTVERFLYGATLVAIVICGVQYFSTDGDTRVLVATVIVGLIAGLCTVARSAKLKGACLIAAVAVIAGTGWGFFDAFDRLDQRTCDSTNPRGGAAREDGYLHCIKEQYSSEDGMLLVAVLAAALAVLAMSVDFGRAGTAELDERDEQ